MGKEYGIQLAKEALNILRKDPTAINKAIGELLVGQFEDFEVDNYLTIKELYPTYIKSEKYIIDNHEALSIQIINLCLDIINSKKNRNVSDPD